MKSHCCMIATVVVVYGLLLGTPIWADIYTQPFDGTGIAYSSQNDTIGEEGLFAQVYDNFQLASTAITSGVEFTGEYFNPPQQGQITAFTINFYADAAGQPGRLLSIFRIAGNGGETFLGIYDGNPTYTYSISGVDFMAQAETQYWISVVPDVGFPPQWGWSTGFGGDSREYQDFFGTRTLIAADSAFTLTGGCGYCGPPVPEPGTLVMTGTAIVTTGALGASGLGTSALGTSAFSAGLLGLARKMRKRMLTNQQLAIIARQSL